MCICNIIVNAKDESGHSSACPCHPSALARDKRIQDRVPRPDPLDFKRRGGKRVV